MPFLRLLFNLSGIWVKTNSKFKLLSTFFPDNVFQVIFFNAVQLHGSFVFCGKSDINYSYMPLEVMLSCQLKKVGKLIFEWDR